jgi:hypothetical protein
MVDWGFAIPTNATIKGIVLELARYGGSYPSFLTDLSVKLIKSDNTLSASNLKILGSYPVTAGVFNSTYGSATELWGETWTPADINSANFGVAYQCQKTCFPAGTMINLPDIDDKPIEDLKVGDLVYSDDMSINEITEIRTHQATRLVRIKVSKENFGYFEVKSTVEHPFKTPNGFTELVNIDIGDLVLVWGHECEVKEKEIIDGEVLVYDLSVKNDPHTYNANGFAVHNKSPAQPSIDAERLTIYYSVPLVLQDVIIQ